MGCAESQGLSEELKKQRKRSEKLDKELRRTVNNNQHVHKILLLGAGGCGKSTIMKQMKEINGAQKSEEELKMFAGIIRNNLLSAVRAMAKQSTSMGVFDLEKKTILPLAQRFQALDQKKIDEISRNGLDEKEVEEWAQSIDTFWKDEVIQQVYERGNEYNLLESAKYFIADVGARTILPRDYVPDHEHCVHSRKATEAITEYTFFDSVKKMAKITLVDVGGQRDRRKKWIRCFEHVTCILFIASLADYDMNLEEDETRNRMYESIDLFYGVRNMEWFRNTPIVLFLNKHDKFLEKIEKKELPFVDYEGGNDADKAYEYIESAFRGDPADDDMYVYKTVAVDKNNINKIWNTVRDVVTNKNMVDMGMAPPVY